MTDPQFADLPIIAKGTSQAPMLVRVRIVDRRVAFGRDEVLVAPVVGEGQQWVLASRLRFPENEED